MGQQGAIAPLQGDKAVSSWVHKHVCVHTETAIEMHLTLQRKGILFAPEGSAWPVFQGVCCTNILQKRVEERAVVAASHTSHG